MSHGSEGPRPFRLIPVIDLRHGRVVRARAGERDAYAPIDTPLARGSKPADIARGLLEAVGGDRLYVADLDAIMDGTEPDRASLEAVARACPGVTLWVDAGFSDLSGLERFVHSGLGHPVIGSESQRDAALVRALGDRAVLSLDCRGETRLGPDILHDDAEAWPEEVIVMTLARVGTGTGPDLFGVSRVVALGENRRIYAAGGVRGPEDVARLREAGAAGALVASAIHDGRLR
ncbi:histidine biosynthesis protein [Methylorubrum populi BJ001]|jgi:phosphoribosylformimino-5-aminoimidazole carboxamide ribotide isomerase|uniref:Histidine biosynthesis protein n=1 Tax=Methylorubrum populi (strain ATCC BAA-705 / NCIMB 13946 / BJ001) TaxID=441620 RepID=B1ZIC9_METPB|nr:HisA/HisF-related TIM barrel protein [Methylorubrum populi]ACB79949.1 histidine biosynthesis protein [Methylorubrum populi BJ001]OAH33194.1 nickel transporter [Methylorubrum populi]PZP72008.1 MAG: nickel transporter [Methylorubrum populi]